MKALSRESVGGLNEKKLAIRRVRTVLEPREVSIESCILEFIALKKTKTT